MSYGVLTGVIERSEATGNDRLVLIMLAGYGDHEGRGWVALEKLAAEARLPQAAVVRSLGRLFLGDELMKASLNRQEGVGAKLVVFEISPRLFGVKA